MICGVKRGKADCLPFGVDRNLGTDLADQIVGNVSLAIGNGSLENGAQLPGIRRLAKELDVSEITVRRAVKELCGRGLLQARPRVGLTVCGGGRSWRGVVVGVRSAYDSGMYYANVLEGAISSALMRRGWLFARMEWPDAPGKAATDVMGILKCFSPALVVASFPPPAMVEALGRSGIPHAFVWPPAKTSAKARLLVRVGADVALSKLAATFAAHGVRKVLSVYQHVSGIDFTTALKSAGLSVRSMRVCPLNGYLQPESVQRAALETFDRMLSKGPLGADAVVFNDDFLAAGALSAFDRHGVRMPDDIRLATLSNCGLGPVHFRTLTRLEIDPIRHGNEIAENLLKILDGEAVPRQMEVELTFKKGESA